MPPSDPDDFSSTLERAKRASTGQLLMRCARLFNEQAIARASERFGVPMRTSHTTLFPHVDLAGTRLTELARRMGVSKQAVGQLVGELEEYGVLERVPDPTDGRAKLVRFTAAGQRSLLDGIAVLNELEQELMQRLGPRRMRSLHTGLLALMDLLESEPESEPDQ